MNRQGLPGAKSALDLTDATSLELDAASINCLAAVIERISREDFDRRLLAWIGSLVSFDSAVILLYAERQRPKILVDALDNPDRRNTVQHYVDGAYLLDPFYLHAHRFSEACLVQLHDIVPDDFSKSDYVETYYRRSAIRDEVNVFIPVGPVTYAISVERSIREASFSKGDLRTLDQLLPLLNALIRLDWSRDTGRHAQEQPDSEHIRLERILAEFGRDRLTPREREVVGLMLRGHALAQIAARLKISLETARVHRRNIYDKLGISSLAELFSRALAELAAGR